MCAIQKVKIGQLGFQYNFGIKTTKHKRWEISFISETILADDVCLDTSVTGNVASRDRVALFHVQSAV